MANHKTPHESDARAGAQHGARNAPHLSRLDEMRHYKVADGDPDVRGWDVKTSDGTRVGKVDTLIVDTDALKVRYLDVELDARARAADDAERHVMLPIGTALLDEKEDCVLLGARSSGELDRMSTAGRTALDRNAEVAMRRHGDRDYKDDGDDFYAHPDYDQDRFFGTRRGDRARGTYFVLLGDTSSDAARGPAGQSSR